MIGFWKIVTVRITTNCQAPDYFGRSRGSARYQRDQSALIVARSYQKHACATLEHYVIFSDVPKLLCFVCPSMLFYFKKNFCLKKMSCNISLFHLYVLNVNVFPPHPTPLTKKCGIIFRFFVICRCLVVKLVSMNDSNAISGRVVIVFVSSWSVGNFDDTGCQTYAVWLHSSLPSG